MLKELLVVRELKDDEGSESWEMLETFEGAVVEGKVLEMGAGFKQFLDVGGDIFDFDAVKAKLFDLGGFPCGFDSFADLIFSPFRHASQNIREFRLINYMTQSGICQQTFRQN